MHHPGERCESHLVSASFCFLLTKHWRKSPQARLLKDNKRKSSLASFKNVWYYYLASLNKINSTYVLNKTQPLWDVFQSTLTVLSLLSLQRDGCPKIVNLGSSKTDLFYERKKYGFKKRWRRCGPVLVLVAQLLQIFFKASRNIFFVICHNKALFSISFFFSVWLLWMWNCSRFYNPAHDHSVWY